MNSARLAGLLLGGVFAGQLVLSALGLMYYPGSKVVFTGFCACYIALLGLIVPRPRSYVYLFLAGFLYLGFWLKTIAHLVWQMQFIEPTGDFTGLPKEWDAGMMLAAAGALGAVVARIAHLWVVRYRRAQSEPYDECGVPAWFTAWRQPIWVLTIALIICVNILNVIFSFYQVGVNPKLVLPLHLNVIVGWLINIGFALWLATLFHWDLRAGKGSIGGFMATMLEALLSSITAQSRFFFLLHAGPYWLVSAERRQTMRNLLTRMSIPLLVTCFLVLLWLSISTITRFRFEQYFDVPRLSSKFSADRYYGDVANRHVPRLFVQRWVGLESALTATSVPGRSYKLFRAALADDPRLGADSLFQKAAGTPYRSRDATKFTFLTNAGPIALLGLSGSIVVPFLGMAMLVLLLIVTEHIAAHLTMNPFFVAVAGAGLANVASQMTFPYLSLIFLLQLWLATAFISFLQRLRLDLRPARL